MASLEVERVVPRLMPASACSSQTTAKASQSSVFAGRWSAGIPNLGFSSSITICGRLCKQRRGSSCQPAVCLKHCPSAVFPVRI